MGLKSAKVIEDFDFGMRARKKVLDALWSLLEWKKCWMARENVWPMIFHVVVKKAPLNPSRPRELFCLGEKITALISSDEGEEMRREFSETETLGLLTWTREGLGLQSRGLKRLEKKSTAWALMIDGSWSLRS